MRFSAEQWCQAVGKTVSVDHMLNAGRRDSRTTIELSAEATRQLGVESPRRSDTEATSEVGAQAPRQLDAQTTRPPNSETTSRLISPPATYQRQTVFFTPEQRQWLKATTKWLPVEGLSGSDVVRLALSRLRQDVEDGRLELVEALTSQAHTEVETMAGRRNRGLPPLEGHGRGSRSSRGNSSTGIEIHVSPGDQRSEVKR